MPIRAAGATRFKAFNYGQASAIVEPIFATIGAIAIIFITPVLPYALAFAAGAMIFVVVEELIPDSQSSNNTDLATLSNAWFYDNDDIRRIIRIIKLTNKPETY